MYVSPLSSLCQLNSSFLDIQRLDQYTFLNNVCSALTLRGPNILSIRVFFKPHLLYLTVIIASLLRPSAEYKDSEKSRNDGLSSVGRGGCLLPLHQSLLHPNLSS